MKIKLILTLISSLVLISFLNVNAGAQSNTPNQYGNDPIVVLTTNQGDITLRLFPDVAPKAVENFLGLCQKGYYNNVTFHRVIKGFMIQGGDPTATGYGGKSIWGKPFENEVSKYLTFDKPGLLAMANAGPNTNGSQFFITVNKEPRLNMKYTIFGEVVGGYNVVLKIDNAETGPHDKPIIDQTILKTKVMVPAPKQPAK